MPANDSLFWPWLKSTTILVAAIVAVSVGYREGFIAKSDIPVVLGVLLPYIGIEVSQRFMNKAPPSP